VLIPKLNYGPLEEPALLLYLSLANLGGEIKMLTYFFSNKMERDSLNVLKTLPGETLSELLNPRIKSFTKNS